MVNISFKCQLLAETKKKNKNRTSSEITEYCRWCKESCRHYNLTYLLEMGHNKRHATVLEVFLSDFFFIKNLIC